MKAINLRKTWFLVLYLLAAFPLWPKAFESILMIFFFVLSVFLFFFEKKKINRKIKMRETLILSSVFITYLLSSTYSDNNSESLRFLVLSAPILMFALCFGLLSNEKITNKHFSIVKIIYVGSLFLSLLIAHIYLKMNAIDNISNWEYRNLFEDFTKVHGSYFSLWIGLGILILINDSFSQKRDNKIACFFIIITLISYFFYWQFTIMARLPFSATIVLGAFLLLKKVKKKNKIILVTITFIIITSIAYFKTDTIKNSISFTLPEGTYELMHKEMTSEQIRTGIYYCSSSLIKNSLLFGYGIGDVNEELNNCYKENIKSNVYQLFHFNSHNQYIQAFLSAGLFGFSLFLLTGFSIFKRAFTNKDDLFIMLILLLSICFTTENILSRHDGVIFYSYFTSLFYFKSSKEESL